MRFSVCFSVRFSVFSDHFSARILAVRGDIGRVGPSLAKVSSGAAYPGRPRGGQSLQQTGFWLCSSRVRCAFPDSAWSWLRRASECRHCQTTGKQRPSVRIGAFPIGTEPKEIRHMVTCLWRQQKTHFYSLRLLGKHLESIVSL